MLSCLMEIAVSQNTLMVDLLCFISWQIWCKNTGKGRPIVIEIEGGLKMPHVTRCRHFASPKPALKEQGPP